MSETAKLHAAAGHEFDAYIAKPQGESKAAIIVLQEIFGVNHQYLLSGRPLRG